MHDVINLPLSERIFEKNDRIALQNREYLTKLGIYAINVMGAPGVGKTSVLSKIIHDIIEYPSTVIEGDIESNLDTATLRTMGIDAYQINTFGACHLDAPMINTLLGNIKPHSPGLLWIENVGNLVCPAEFLIGEHLRLLVLSVMDGSDKPYKYPLAFEKADLILLNKTDLLPWAEFDSDFFFRGVRDVNEHAPIYLVSAKTGEGLPEVRQQVIKQAELICSLKGHAK